MGGRKDPHRRILGSEVQGLLQLDNNPYILVLTGDFDSKGWLQILDSDR